MVALFSWARPQPLQIRRRLPPDQPITIVSDLHLGDGTRSDIFLSKDQELTDLLEQVRAEGGHLVIAGDAIDFHQAWAMSRVIKAHARLMGELASFADSHGITYIWGNHDYDISLFKDLLRFDVCSELEIGDRVLVRHGYEYDPYIGPNLEQSHLTTRIHHLAERLLDTWMRLPLENFYTLANRIAFWIFHKYALLGHVRAWLYRRFGWKDAARAIEAELRYWIQNQLGDPGCMFDGIRTHLEEGPYDIIVCGHSHLPGRIEVAPGKVYVNTGSWTFRSAQYARWDGHDFVVRDWLSGREYGPAPYLPLLEQRYAHMTFMEWWRENYLGWLRYREPEEERLAR